MGPRLEILDRGFRGIVHSVAHGAAWASQGRRIVRRRHGAAGWEPFATLPVALPRDALRWTRLLERASRADQCVVHPVEDDLALVVRASTVWRVRAGEAAPLGVVQGDCPLKASVAVAPDGSHVFGEYFLNPERVAVRVWRAAPDLSGVEPAHEFAAGEIRHVHGVQEDPYAPGTLWVTTGDRDGECYLWRSDDNLRTLERVGDGTQLCRAVSLHFTADHVVWFTDSNLVQNWRMTLDRRTGRIERHEPVESSVWYGARTADGTYLAATTVEVGPGVRTSEATVLVSADGHDWRPLRRFRKDPWRPAGVFKYGVLSFAAGPLARDGVWISGEGLWQLDGLAAECALGEGP
jgi:hypothetical protein